VSESARLPRNRITRAPRHWEVSGAARFDILGSVLSKRRALDELRELGDTLGAVRSIDVQQRGSNQLYLSLLRHFGSLRAAREAAAVDAPLSRNLKWTREKVIEELQRLHRRGARLTDRGLSKAGARGLSNAARAFFASLPRARRAAGVLEPPPLIIERRTWDEETVIAEILDLHRAGKSLAATKAPPKLVSAGAYRFGSWQGAVETAGLDYDRVRLVRAPYTRDELLDMLRKLAKQRPRATLQDLWNHRVIDAWKREFGSVEAAARAAGLRDWPRRKLRPPLSRAAVTSALRERYRAKRSMHGADVAREDPYLYSSAVRQFGTWRSAVIGRLPSKARTQLRVHWTKAMAIKAMRARKRAGKSMNPAHLRRDDESLYYAAKRLLGYNAEVATRDWGAQKLQTHWTKTAVMRALRESHRSGEPLRAAVTLAALNLFGSVIAAREAAGLPLLRTVWTDERVLDEIRALGGEKPSVSLVSIAQWRFGSWRAALDAAGVPAKLRPRWEPATIAAALREYAKRGLALDSTTLRRENQSLYDALRNRWGRERVGAILVSFAKTKKLPYLPPPPSRGRPSHRLRA